MRCGACGLLLVVASGCGGPGRGPGGPPPDWTHKNLVEHLEQRGIKVVAELAPLHTTDEAIAAGFFEGEVRSGSPSVLVILCRDGRAAAEHVNELGPGAFSYGQFAIGPWPKRGPREKDADLLRRIKVVTTKWH